MATEQPKWLRQRAFVAPITLVKRMLNFSVADQLNLCRVVSMVVIATKKNPVLFANIRSKDFKNVIGTDYRKCVDQLVAWKIIEANQKYSNDPASPFPKSFRLTHRSAATPMEEIIFPMEVVQPLKDRSNITDDVAAFVLRNLQRLTARSDLLPQANMIDWVNAKQWAKKIWFGQFNVHYSAEAKRMFHTVIEMPRIARRNLVLKESPKTPLYEYDIKSCHPVLMLALVKKSEDDVNGFTELLNGDIYSTVAKDCGIEADREDLKEDFLKFANGGVTNYYHAYFLKRFPRLVRFMDRNKEEMAWFCQASEARIMTQIVPRLLMSSGSSNTRNAKHTKPPLSLSLICGSNPECFYIPMHDGWLGIEKDEQRIAGAVREDFYKRLGFWVTITKAQVTGGEKATLLEGPPKVAAEPMRRYGRTSNV